ncbi:reticulophagy regulator 3-like [Anguilla anguilla]|uniref:reticulophagy regulator 3-like n=1 Tax=Anguilla anguilla TaxID=7936 RepID=UPI0015B31F87|nr:reticulophagy regulator 3-like [Anguilla anguilla]XP_035254388.1 reticulophagy regulator 3-like [Anguilla anguilla]XP_035254389.1 reticulophagy regulator 3-like [Anguilla anguilla]
MALKTQEGAAKPGSGVGLRSRPFSSERDGQVRAVKASLLERLGPYEPVLTYLQSVLVWEKPLHSVLLYTVINAIFWFFVMSSLRLLFLLSTGLAAAVCVDTWRNCIWPKIRVKRASDTENESWGLVHPGTLSVPELCHHMAEAWVSGSSFAGSCVKFKQEHSGKFCVLACGCFTLLAVVGHYIPGLALCYSAVLAVLLFPLAVYHRTWVRLCVLLEPALRRLDFSARGYMMSQPKQNQFLCRPVGHMTPADASDSEEELAAFCPTLDDTVVARELAITDSEHSDAEASYTDNGTFNLSRGPTPLTESLEDLDRHSDPEESFARDLSDFPSINPDAAALEDDDDTSIGLPSLGPSGLSGSRSAALLDLEDELDSDPEDELDSELSFSGLTSALTSGRDLTSEMAGAIASSVFQAALEGALQPRPPTGARGEGHAQPHAARSRGFRHQSSSELDTDLDGEEFELLDQSELSQMDPCGAPSQGGLRSRTQGPSFLSSLLGKPQ